MMDIFFKKQQQPDETISSDIPIHYAWLCRSSCTHLLLNVFRHLMPLAQTSPHSHILRGVPHNHLIFLKQNPILWSEASISHWNQYNDATNIQYAGHSPICPVFFPVLDLSIMFWDFFPLAIMGSHSGPLSPVTSDHPFPWPRLPEYPNCRSALRSIPSLFLLKSLVVWIEISQTQPK